jgi:hypothetical protein
MDGEQREGRHFTLKAKSREEAEAEMARLDKLAFKKWNARWQHASAATGYGPLYDEWCAALGLLRKKVAAVQKIPARTLTGVDLKSRIAVLTDTAFDDEMWTEKLRASIIADLRRLAASNS